MTKRQERINELRTKASMIQFSSVLTEHDYNTLAKIDAEIKRLEAKQHGGWVVLIYPNFQSISNEPSFLTDDSTLCMGDAPTYFQTKKEAMEYLRKAQLNPRDWRTEVRKEVR